MDIVIIDFLVFFYATFDAEFKSQGVDVYEASFVLFVGFFKIRLQAKGGTSKRQG
jgi:hypothetical protein